MYQINVLIVRRTKVLKPNLGLRPLAFIITPSSLSCHTNFCSSLSHLSSVLRKELLTDSFQRRGNSHNWWRSISSRRRTFLEKPTGLENEVMMRMRVFLPDILGIKALCIFQNKHMLFMFEFPLRNQIFSCLDIVAAKSISPEVHFSKEKRHMSTLTLPRSSRSTKT